MRSKLTQIILAIKLQSRLRGGLVVLWLILVGVACSLRSTPVSTTIPLPEPTLTTPLIASPTLIPIPPSTSGPTPTTSRVVSPAPIPIPTPLKEYITLDNNGNPIGLSLSNRSLTELPPEIGQLTNLGYLDLSSNPLNQLPPKIKKLPKGR